MRFTNVNTKRIVKASLSIGKGERHAARHNSKSTKFNYPINPFN